MGVDVKRLRALSRLSRPHRRDRRIQRQVHVQPNGVARRRVRDAAIAHARWLPLVLLCGGPLAIRRHPSRGRRVMGALRFYDQHPAPAQLLSEVVVGLRATPRRISPKFFYDQRGSELFYEICRLPEYYVTRTEMAILRVCAVVVAWCLGVVHVVVELGCGASDKARILLQAVRPRAYVPIDISRASLLACAAHLVEDHPAMEVHAICADYTLCVVLFCLVSVVLCLVFIHGSTLGIFVLVVVVV